MNIKVMEALPSRIYQHHIENPQYRMLSYGNASYGYLANGSLTFKAGNGDTTFYNYDLPGNLVNVLLPDGIFIEYLIDGQNRRVGKKVNGQFKKGWLYQDQLNPVAELDSLGNVISRFVYGAKGHPAFSGQVVPDYMVKSDSTYRFITDHLGSVRLVVNAETGTIAQRIDYDAFGNVLSYTNPDFQPFGYAGGLYDSHTGLVRFGARDYDAEAGRWTAKEPIGFGGKDSNIYVYAHNSPVLYLDPTGCQNFYNNLFTASLDHVYNSVKYGLTRVLDTIKPDGYTVTISGSGIVGGGPEIGLEFVYMPGKGVYVYIVTGGGAGLSVAASMQLGAIWNMACPKDYAGVFNELQGSYGLLCTTYSWVSNGPTAFTIGASLGPSSISPIGGGAYVSEYSILLGKI